MPSYCLSTPDSMRYIERLPEALFDAHAHLYANPDPAGRSDTRCATPPPGTFGSWQKNVGKQVRKDRLKGGLFMPFPRGNPYEANAWLETHLRNTDPDNAAMLVLATPAMTRKDGETCCRNPRVRGFKPYHIFSTETPTFESTISGYVPEWVWELCHEAGLIVVLHLVRHRALADKSNLAELSRVCRRYPNARIVLAHAGRGFHAPNTPTGLQQLQHFRNLWFDSSGVCEPAALTAILQDVGPHRLLWGSDFPVSENRGKCVTVGDNFAWINPGQVDTPPNSPRVKTMPVGCESLSALIQACDALGLNPNDLEAICDRNARELLGLPAVNEQKQDRRENVQQQYVKAKQRIPGGTQLLSKRPEMFAPGQWPAYFRQCRGCDVWDTDGKHYLDFSYNGIGACLLGFRDPEVTRAVMRRLVLGSMCTLNPPEELELAEALCRIHPWAQCARFARTGGEIAAVAVRIARATTGRSRVAICGYHGWHDWYLAANLGDEKALDGHLLPGLSPRGVPRELTGTATPFPYDDTTRFMEIIETGGDQLACVVMEPCRHHPPKTDFIETVRRETQRRGIILIFDEITVGFRIAVGGAHLTLGVTPDIAIFAKALGNGHPIAAAIGTEQAMEGAHTSFISSTYWTESIGPAAALATLRKMQTVNLPEHLARVGRIVRKHWRQAAEENALPVRVHEGFDCMPRFEFVHEQANELKTLYTQTMLQYGALATTAFVPTLAHDDDSLAEHRQRVAKSFRDIARALETGPISEALKAPPAHRGFARLVT